MGYSVTNSDRLAMIELLNYAWNVTFKASRDKAGASSTQSDGTVVKGLPAHTRWDIQAVNPVNTTYYTVDGDTIAEAVGKYFTKMEEVNGAPVEREVWTSLWDAKMDLVKDDILGFEEGVE